MKTIKAVVLYKSDIMILPPRCRKYRPQKTVNYYECTIPVMESDEDFPVCFSMESPLQRRSDTKPTMLVSRVYNRHLYELDDSPRTPRQLLQIRDDGTILLNWNLSVNDLSEPDYNHVAENLPMECKKFASGELVFPSSISYSGYHSGIQTAEVLKSIHDYVDDWVIYNERFWAVQDRFPVMSIEEVFSGKTFLYVKEDLIRFETARSEESIQMYRNYFRTDEVEEMEAYILQRMTELGASQEDIDKEIEYLHKTLSAKVYLPEYIILPTSDNRLAIFIESRVNYVFKKMFGAGNTEKLKNVSLSIQKKWYRMGLGYDGRLEEEDFVKDAVTELLLQR